MATAINKTLKREVSVGDKVLTVVMTPTAILAVPKRGRIGQAITWELLAAVCAGRFVIIPKAGT